MSKRFYPQSHRDNKKAKLDISVTDHNFPPSQTNIQHESVHTNDWADDSVDDLLLLATQVCENDLNSDITQLPNYTVCMQPTTSSTQYNIQGPSTSKDNFTFQRPAQYASATISIEVNNNCNRISPPLPGISSSLVFNQKKTVDLTDDFIFNDKIYNGQESVHIKEQLLKLQQENAKLKSENFKLLDKCVTKDGEVSILRTQLKNSQVSANNARLEKIEAQEKVQMEWNKKLEAVNNQLHDLKSQLDFKNMEIISIKEKCKNLVSTKVNLTQVTIGGNDMSMSIKNSHYPNEPYARDKRVKTSSSSVQTDNKARFLKLNVKQRLEPSPVLTIIPHLLKSQTEQQHYILDYSEKLKKHTEQVGNKCRLYSTFHKASVVPIRKENEMKVQTASVCEDLSAIANGDNISERYFNVFNVIRLVLQDVWSRLESIFKRLTPAFQKDMDAKYIEATSSYTVLEKIDLTTGKALYKEEQDILARRMVMILPYILETSRGMEVFNMYEKREDKKGLFEIINRICDLLDSTSCGILYSGLLLSILHMLGNMIEHTDGYREVFVKGIKSMIKSRPMPHVCSHLLYILRKLSVKDKFQSEFCIGSYVGNLTMDYDKKVLLYKKDSCYLQVMLKQIEVCLKCAETQKLTEVTLEITRNLISLDANLNFDNNNIVQDKSRCGCNVILSQNIVYALRICAVTLNRLRTDLEDCLETSGISSELLAVCRCGIQTVYQWYIKDTDSSPRLGYNEGHLIEFYEIMKSFDHSWEYEYLLRELSIILPSLPEEWTPYNKDTWLKSFETLALAD